MNIIRKFYHAKQSVTDTHKTISKKKQQKQLVIWLVIKLLIELRKSQEVYHNMVPKQLQMNMLKKYLKKDIYISRRKAEIYWLI